jgi:hypothetical protein
MISLVFDRPAFGFWCPEQQVKACGKNHDKGWPDVTRGKQEMQGVVAVGSPVAWVCL